jgi:Glycosyltransferase
MPEYDRYKYLDKPATRICVSDALTKMTNKIQHVNGDVITIPAGTEIKELKVFAKKPKRIDILISALKNPSMGKALKSQFETIGVNVQLLDKRMDRSSFIEYMSAAAIVVCLPNPMEGFYLPALEAMAMNALVVCPHAIGNDYCEDGINCLVPIYTEKEIFNATMKMLSLSNKEATEMRENATSTVNAHDIAFEKQSFHNLLDKILKDS